DDAGPERAAERVLPAASSRRVEARAIHFPRGAVLRTVHSREGGGMRALTGLAAAVAGASVIAAGTVAVLNGHPGASPAGNVPRAAAARPPLPLVFVPNRGQTDARVRFYAQGTRYGFYLTRDRVVLSLLGKRKDRGVALALRFLGANARSAP